MNGIHARIIPNSRFIACIPGHLHDISFGNHILPDVHDTPSAKRAGRRGATTRRPTMTFSLIGVGDERDGRGDDAGHGPPGVGEDVRQSGSHVQPAVGVQRLGVGEEQDRPERVHGVGLPDELLAPHLLLHLAPHRRVLEAPLGQLLSKLVQGVLQGLGGALEGADAREEREAEAHRQGFGAARAQAREA